MNLRHHSRSPINNHLSLPRLASIIIIIIATLAIGSSSVAAQTCVCNTWKTYSGDKACENECDTVCTPWLNVGTGSDAWWYTVDPEPTPASPYAARTDVIAMTGKTKEGDEWSTSNDKCTEDQNNGVTMIKQNTTNMPTYLAGNPCHFVNAYRNGASVVWESGNANSTEQSNVLYTLWPSGMDCDNMKMQFQKLGSVCVPNACCDGRPAIAQVAEGQKRQRACQRLGDNLEWRRRSAGQPFEDIFVPHRMTYANARTFCRQFGSWTRPWAVSDLGVAVEDNIAWIRQWNTILQDKMLGTWGGMGPKDDNVRTFSAIQCGTGGTKSHGVLWNQSIPVSSSIVCEGAACGGVGENPCASKTKGEWEKWKDNTGDSPFLSRAFWCTRQLVTPVWKVHYSTKPSNVPCFANQNCAFKFDLLQPLVREKWHRVSYSFTMGGPGCTGTSWTAVWNVGDREKELIHNCLATGTYNQNNTLTATLTSGYGFNNISTWDFMIHDRASLLFDYPTSWVRTLYHGQTVTYKMRRYAPTVNPYDYTYGTGVTFEQVNSACEFGASLTCLVVSSVSANTATDEITFTVDSTTGNTTQAVSVLRPQDTSYYWTRSNFYHRFNVFPTSVVRKSGPAFLVANQIITRQLYIDAPTSLTAPLTVDITSSCPQLIISPAQIVFANQSWKPSFFFNVSAPANFPSSQNCYLTYTRSGPVNPQFPNAPGQTTIEVRALITLSLSADTTTPDVNLPATVTVTASNFLSSGKTVTVSPVCTGATITVVDNDFADNDKTTRFTVLRMSAGSCIFSVFTYSGDGANQIHTTLPVLQITWSSSYSVATSLTPSDLNIGYTTNLTVSDGNRLVTTQTITMNWTVTPSNLFSPSSGTVSLSGTVPTVRWQSFILTAINNGTGTVSFNNVVVPMGWVSTVAPRNCEIYPRLTVSVSPASLPVNFSTGAVNRRDFTVVPSAVPRSGTIIVTPRWLATYFTVTPTSHSWLFSETLAGKVFTVTAISDHAALNISFDLSGTSTDFDTTVMLGLGYSRLYTKKLVNATESEITLYMVAGAYKDFDVKLQTVQAVGVAVAVTSQATTIATVGAASVVVPAGATTAAVRVTVAAVGSTTITYAVTTSNNPQWVLDELALPIPSTTVNVLAALPIHMACNSTELFFGPGPAISCTANVSNTPSADLRLTPDSANIFFVSNVPALSFASTQITFIITPRLDPLPTVSQGLGSVQTLKWTVADQNIKYDKSDITVSIQTRQVLFVQIQQLQPEKTVYIGKSFVLSVSTNDPVPLGTTLTFTPLPALAALTYTTAADTLTNNDPPQKRNVTVQASVAGEYDFEFAVTGSSSFASKSVKKRVLVSQLETIGTSASATQVFVGQTISFTVSISLTQSAMQSQGLSVTVSWAFYCSGSPSPSSIDSLSASSATFDSSSVTHTFTFRPAQQCTSGAFRFTRTGSDVFATPADYNMQLYNKKVLTASFESADLYAGNNPPTVPAVYPNSTNLALQVSGLPLNTNGKIRIDLINNDNKMIIGSSFIEFKNGDETMRQTVNVKSDMIWAARTMTITLNVSGSAMTEYDFPLAPIAINVKPPVNVSVSTALETPDNKIWVGIQFQRTVVVSLPLLPQGGRTITVTPNYNDGSPDGIVFIPTVATLSAANPSVSFTVRAVRETVGLETVSFTYTGTASEYFPQPESRRFPVQFINLGTISLLGTPPATLFQGASVTISLRVSYTPPAGKGQVQVNLATCAGGHVSLSTSSVLWTTGAPSNTLTFNIVGNTLVSECNVSMSVASTSNPSIYQTSVTPVAWFVVRVVDAKAIIFTLPPFIYLNGQTTNGRIELLQLPAEGLQLDIVPAIDAAVTPMGFTPETITFKVPDPLSKVVQVFGKNNFPGTYTVSGNLLGSAADNYTQPAPQTVEVRAKETVTVSGLKAKMYAAPDGSTSIEITVTVSRLPIASGSNIVVTPEFRSSDAQFIPASLTFKNDGTSLSQKTTLYAYTATAGQVEVRLTLTGTTEGVVIFDTNIIRSPNIPGVTIYSKETVSVTAMQVDLSGVGFAYKFNELALRISIGTPQITPHNNVTVTLGYEGQAGSAEFRPAQVVFQNGETEKTVQMYAAQTSPAAAISISVVSTNNVFQPALTMPQVRLLPLIPVTLSFSPTQQLIVVDVTQQATITLSSAALVGQLIVTMRYGAAGTEVEFGSPLVFEAKTPQTSQVQSFTGLVDTLGVRKNLTLSFSGTGGTFYTFDSANSPFVPVYPRQQVLLISSPSVVYIGAANAEVVRINVTKLPTLAGDSVLVSLALNSIVTFNETSVALSQISPSGGFTIEGKKAGTINLLSFLSVTSNKNEFRGDVAALFGLSSNVEIRLRLTAQCPEFVNQMFVNSNMSFNVTIPSLPIKGPLTLTPQLIGFAVTFSPPTLVFSNVPGSPQRQLLTIRSGADPSASTGTFQLAASGSTEYENIVFSSGDTFRVIAADVVAVSGFVAEMYPGAVNAITLTIAISQLPVGNLTITPTVDNGVPIVFLPSSIVFDRTSASTVATISMRATGSTPSTTVSFVLAEEPTPFFVTPPSRSIAVLTLADVTLSYSSNFIYVGQAITVTVNLGSIPSSEFIITMAVRKNQTQSVMSLVPMSSSEVTVPQYSLNLQGQSSGTFTATALIAPINAEFSYTLSGAGTTRFVASDALPRFVVSFKPKRVIEVSVPPTMYATLSSNITMTIEQAPESDGVSLTVSSFPAEIMGTSSALLAWSSPTAPRTLVFAYTPLKDGAATVSFLVGLNGNFPQLAYSNKVVNMNKVEQSSFGVVVKNPAVVGLQPLPVNVFFGQANAISFKKLISGDDATLVPGVDKVTLTLTTDGRNVVIQPESATMVLPDTSGEFTVYSTKVGSARFNLSFTSKVNRLTLADDVTNVVVNFRPLKTITVTKPGTSYIVGQVAQFVVTVAELPSAGHTLYAQLQYGGSEGNIELPSAVQWKSDSTVLSRVLSFRGLSPTAMERLSVVFTIPDDVSNTVSDPQYNTTRVDAFVRFQPLLNVIQELPTSAYFNRTISNITMRVDTLGQVVSVIFSTTPANAIEFWPPWVNWTAGDPTAIKKVAMRPLVFLESVTVHFRFAGRDASKFNALADHRVSIIDSSSILIHAPSTQMTAYLKGGLYVEISVEISGNPSGTMYTTLTWACQYGSVPFANFSVNPLVFTETSPLKLTTQISGLRAWPTWCALEFPLSGATQGFTGTSRLYSVRVRDLYQITASTADTRVYLGPENKRELFIVLDKDYAQLGDATLVQPLQEQIVAMLYTTEPCLKVNPTTLIWAAGSNSEPLRKPVNIEASCTGSSLRVYMNVTTKNVIFNVSLPEYMVFDAVPRLKITVSHTSGKSSFSTTVGDKPLSFDVSIPEPLAPDEGLEVRPVYSGIAGSITPSNAIWIPSPLKKTTQVLLIEANTVSPQGDLKFVATAPPRFDKTIAFSGTLEIFGPLRAVADVPSEIFAATNYSFAVELGDKPDPGVTVFVTPFWSGDKTSIIFDPPFLSFTFADRTSKLMTLAALRPCGSFPLRFDVTGSQRFQQSAFSGFARVRAPTYVVSGNVPLQLMMGQTYSISVDISLLPPPGEELSVFLIAKKLNLLTCLTLEPSKVTFSATMPLPTTVLYFIARPVQPCDWDYVPIQMVVGGSAETSGRYAASPDRLVQTVAAASLTADWQLQGYVGVLNSRRVTVSILDGYKPSADHEIVNVTLKPATPTSCTNASVSPAMLQWRRAEATSQPQQSFTVTGVGGDSTCRLTLSASSNVPYFAFPAQTKTIALFALILVRRSNIPETFYELGANRLRLELNLSASVRYLVNSEPRTVTIRPVSRFGVVKFIPTNLTFIAGQNPSAFVYVEGQRPGFETISFVVEGSGARFVDSSTLLSADTTIQALNRITFTPPPPILYVGSANRRTITLTAPANITQKLAVTITLSGDVNAISVSPSVVEWANARSPRDQYFQITGIFASPINVKFNYKVTQGPSFVDVQSTVGVAPTSVVDLQLVSREPADRIFTLPEQNTVALRFTPRIAVDCIFSPNITIGTVDPLTNDTLNYLERSGISSGRCKPRDTTYAELQSFRIVATAKKRLDPLPTDRVVNFVGTTAFIDFTASTPPSAALVITPEVGNFSQYIDVTPRKIVLSPSIRIARLTVRGVKSTKGQMLDFRVSFAGPIDEFRIDKRTIFFEVFDPLNVTVAPAPAVVTVQAGPQNYRAYIAPPDAGNSLNALVTNGAQFTVTLTGMPLTGSVTVQPVAVGAPDIMFARYVGIGWAEGGQHVFEPRTTTLTYTFIVYSRKVIADADLRLLVGPFPTEYTGLVDFSFGKISMLNLEYIDADPNAPFAQLYVNQENEQAIAITLSGFPRPQQIVSVQVSTPNCPNNVLFFPTALDWQSNYDFPGQPISQIVRIRGKEPSADGIKCLVEFTWWRKSVATATNFWELVRNGQKLLTVRPVITMDVLIPTTNDTAPGVKRDSNWMPCRSGVKPLCEKKDFAVFIYSGEVNKIPLTVALSDLPAFETSSVTIDISVSSSTLLMTSTKKIIFHKRTTDTLREIKLNVWAPLDQTGNASITFKLTGPSEFQNGQTITIPVNVLPLLRFEAQGMRPLWPMGTRNAQKFKIRPSVPARIDVELRSTCPVISAFSTELLVWQESMEWKEVGVVATAVTQGSDQYTDCEFRVIVTGGPSTSAFYSMPFHATVNSVKRPELSVVPFDVTYLQVREGFTMPLAVSGDNFFKFKETLSFSWKTRFNDSIDFSSNFDDASLGLIAFFKKNQEENEKLAEKGDKLTAPLTFSTPVDLKSNDNSRGGKVNVVFARMPDYAISPREIITVTVRNTALQNDYYFEPDRDTFKFTIRGASDINDAAAIAVIGTGASTAVAVGGALSLASATQSGKIAAILGTLICPNPEWKKEQDSLPWNAMVIPMSFGSNDELGVWAAVGVSNLIIVAAWTVLVLLVAGVVYLFRQRGSAWDKSYKSALALTRFPSIAAFPLVMFFFFIVSASFRATFYSQTVRIRAIAAITFILIGFGVPGLIIAILRPGFQAKFYQSDAQFIRDTREVEKEATAGATSIKATRARSAKNEDGSSVEQDGDGNGEGGGGGGGEQEHEMQSVKAGGGGGPRKKAKARREDIEELQRPVLLLPTLEGDRNNDDDETERGERAVAGQRYNPLDDLEDRAGDNLSKRSACMRIILPTGFWRNPNDILWVMHWGMFFDELRGGYNSFLIFDILLVFLLGVLDGIVPSNIRICKIRAAFMIFLFFLQMVLVMYWRPFRFRWANWFFMLAYLLQFLAMVLVGSAMMTENPDRAQLEVAVQMLVFFSLMLFVKTIFDFFMMVKELLGIEAMLKARADGAFAVLNEEGQLKRYNDKMKAEMGDDYEAVALKQLEYEREIASMDPENKKQKFQVNATLLAQDRGAGNEAGAFAELGDDAFAMIEVEHAKRLRQQHEERQKSGLLSPRAAVAAAAALSTSPSPQNAHLTVAQAQTPQQQQQQEPGAALTSGGGPVIQINTNAQGKILLPKSEWDDDGDDEF